MDIQNSALAKTFKKVVTKFSKTASKKIVFTMTALLVPVLGWAGGQATISSGGVQTLLEYDDAGALRMGMQGQEGYMLMRDGRLYTVMDQGGQVMVMEIGAAMAAAGNMLQQQGLIDTQFQSFEALTDTGRTETVAGIEGRVYDLTLIQDDGGRTTETIVLSRDNRVRELTAAMTAMTDTMVGLMGEDEPEGLAMMKQEILGNGHGILRQGNDFVLSSIDGNPPAASRLALPAEPMQIPGMSSLFGGGTPGGTSQPGATGDNAGATQGSVPGVVGEQIERQQQRVQGRTEREVDQAADSAVDRAVDRVFNSIFR